MMKRRGSNRGKDFRAVGRRRAGHKKSAFTRVEGQYDYWRPVSDGVWLHLPEQSWTFEIYDREEGAVVTREEYPYLQYVAHPVTAANTPPGIGFRQFNCSSTAHMTEPCYGCRNYKDFYDEKNRLKEEGIEKEGWSPVGKRTQIAQSGVLMENIYAIMATDKKGKIKKTKKGEPIYNYISEPELGEDMDEEELAKLSRTFGRRVHWSYGPQDFEMLQTFDDRCATRCANCVTELDCLGYICPSCEHVHTFRKPISGEKFEKAIANTRKCKNEGCGYEGYDFVPMLECSGCNEPEQGRLVGVFDLKIRSVKNGDKNSVLQLLDIRLSGTQNILDTMEDYEEGDEEEREVMEASAEKVYDGLVSKPLDLPKIFGPSDLGFQKRCLDRAFVDGVNPSMAVEANEDETEEYDDELPSDL